MKKVLLIFLLNVLLLSSNDVFAWNTLKLHLWNGLNPTNDPALLYKGKGYINYYIANSSVTGTANFLMFEDGWGAKWGESGATVNSIGVLDYNGVDGSVTVKNGYYYTFNFPSNPTADDNNNYAILETSSAPVTINGVSQSPNANLVSDNDNVAITITTSAAPCSEEHFYVCYSTDNWSSFSLASVSIPSGSTIGTATIPAQSAGTNLSYYVFSSTISTLSTFTNSNIDLYTIYYNDNNGPNYSYTVKYGTTQSGNWADDATWKAGAVPGNDKDVIIGHDVTVKNNVGSPATCKDLTINSGKSLTIDAGDALTVTGNLIIDGTLTVKDGNYSTSSNGSLIVNGTITGNATLLRYIPKFSSVTASDGWYEIGCPVTSLVVSGTDWDPTGTPHNDLYYWGETQNKWKNYRNNTFDFSPQKGYLVANETNIRHVFTGVPNTESFTIQDLSYTPGPGNGDGWHLLGNPYPSALKWGTTNWHLSNVAGTAKVWNESKGNYDDVTSGHIFYSIVGFFVQVTSGTNSLTIPAADRMHSAIYVKSATATNPKETLTFKVSNDANGYYDVSTLGFKAHATEGFDMAFDSHKLFSIVKTAPSLWTKSDAQDFSTNYLPETTTAYDVPLHFKPGVSTVYHLTIKGADSFDNTGLVLEDLKTGEKIDLSHTGSYDFSAETGDDVNRFVLHINGVTAVPNVNETDGIQVFSYGNTVYLHGQHMLNGKVSIFNTLGQKVYDGLLNGAAKQQIRVNQHEGIYFVRVEENNYVFTKKVFIQ